MGLLASLCPPLPVYNDSRIHERTFMEFHIGEHLTMPADTGGKWGGEPRGMFYLTMLSITVEPGYNDIGLYDTSSIPPDILWYQLIPHC